MYNSRAERFCNEMSRNAFSISWLKSGLTFRQQPLPLPKAPPLHTHPQHQHSCQCCYCYNNGQNQVGCIIINDHNLGFLIKNTNSLLTCNIKHKTDALNSTYSSQVLSQLQQPSIVPNTPFTVSKPFKSSYKLDLLLPCAKGLQPPHTLRMFTALCKGPIP